MKKIALFALILFTSFQIQAQTAETKIESSVSDVIPVINGKVTFEETIPAEGYTENEVKKIVDSWIKERFVKPVVISAKQFTANNPQATILKGEEYIVFKNTFFVLSRARMYYYLTLTAADGKCSFHLSRITYWYDDEDEKGGLKMIAEEWITDDNAFNKKGKLKRFEGKFRRKTIDLKEHLISELTQVLSK